MSHIAWFGTDVLLDSPGVICSNASMAPLTVLLVDDDDVDVMSVQRAFRRHKIDNPLVVAGDGIEALAILRGANGKPPLPKPYLIFADLNMPRMNGIELLHALRADTRLASSIVFILTTSEAETDKAAVYAHHVAGYMVKSKVADDFKKVVGLIEQYESAVEFPP